VVLSGAASADLSRRASQWSNEQNIQVVKAASPHPVHPRSPLSALCPPATQQGTTAAMVIYGSVQPSTATIPCTAANPVTSSRLPHVVALPLSTPQAIRLRPQMQLHILPFLRWQDPPHESHDAAERVPTQFHFSARAVARRRPAVGPREGESAGGGTGTDGATV
jgi:hypothetical protein